MSNGILYLMCGVPGSGKSTLIQEKMNPETDKWISRDKIRFSIVPENEEYFSQEDKVFKTFVYEINKALKEGFNVFADATHLTPGSRNKLLRAITIKPSSIRCIFMRTPLETALERNENRKGTRAYVPRSTIRKMFYQLSYPNTMYDNFDRIYTVTPDKTITITIPYKEV